MTDIIFRSDVTADLVDFMGDDDRIIHAARVSTAGAAAEPLMDGTTGADVAPMTDLARERFLDFLMRNRHGSPFEHVVFTFFCQAPVFVFRELMRHRIASYNEESSRYKQLDPVFYKVGPERKLVQEGRPGAYKFVQGDPVLYRTTEAVQVKIAETTYEAYELLLEQGVAREVARNVLPLSVYSSAYVTINARSLMNLLSLRTQPEGATFPSFPLYEIQMLAELMTRHFASVAPITWDLFYRNGSVAP